MQAQADTHKPIQIRPIGVIHSPHHKPDRTPIQPVYAEGVKGWVDVYPEFADGLRDLECFSHIYLIYHFHKAPAAKLLVKPFLEDVKHGVFATRAPCRPNPIGFSLVRLTGRAGNALHVEDIDALDGTPLLDIKPYILRFDYRENVRCGWQDGVDESEARKRGRRQHIPEQ